jgi:[ribosomal protein S5]-alanine N-acetyltransferase
MIAWGICLEAQDMPVIGRIALQDFRNQAIAELAYWLARPYWGQGLMSEVLQAELHFGVETLELRRIWAMTDPRNLPSCRLLERNGLVRDGVLRQATYRIDGWADSAIYAELKKDRP